MKLFVDSPYVDSWVKSSIHPSCLTSLGNDPPFTYDKDIYKYGQMKPPFGLFMK